MSYAYILLLLIGVLPLLAATKTSQQTAGRPFAQGPAHSDSSRGEAERAYPQTISSLRRNIAPLSKSQGRSNAAKISQDTPTIHIFAGNGEREYSRDGGPASQAGLGSPNAVFGDLFGNFFVADSAFHVVRKISPDGIIVTVAGNGRRGFSGDGGPAHLASLNAPVGLFVDRDQNLFIADSQNHRIRKVTPQGIISTQAGNGIQGLSGDGGPALQASLSNPKGIYGDGAGNLYISDQGNDRIRQVAAAGTIITIAGNGISRYAGDGGVATRASFRSPNGIFVDRQGSLFIADVGNNRIRKITARGIVSTIAGNGSTLSDGEGGPASLAGLLFPDAIFGDDADNIFVADWIIRRVRKIDQMGIIRHVAGNGTSPPPLKEGPALGTAIDGPTGLFVDREGDILIADPGNHRLLKVKGAAAPYAQAMGIFTYDPASLPAPRLLSSFPPHGSTDADPELFNESHSDIYLVFDRWLEADFSLDLEKQDRPLGWHSSVHQDTIFLRRQGPEVSGKRLEFGTSYRLSLANARELSGITRLDTALEFHTTRDSLSPFIISSTPSDLALDIDPGIERIVIEFNEPLDATFASFLMATRSGEKHPWTARIIDEVRLEFSDPDALHPLQYGTTYDIQIDWLRDRQGKFALQKPRISFSTKPPPADSTITSFDFNLREGDQALNKLATGRPGLTFDLQLHIHDAPPISGWSATIEYDPQQLTFIRGSFRAGSFIPGLVTLSEPKTGQVEIGGALLGSDVTSSGNGELGLLSFAILPRFSSHSEIVVRSVNLRLGNGDIDRRLAYALAVVLPDTTSIQTGLTLDFNLADGDQGQRNLGTAARSFPVQINITNAPPITGWSATVEYDPQKLRYVPESFRASDFVDNMTVLVDDQLGKVSVGGAALGSSTGRAGSGALGSLIFEAVSNFGETTPLTIGEIRLRPANGELIRARVNARATIARSIAETRLTLDGNPEANDQGLREFTNLSPLERRPVQLNIENAPPISGWSALLEFDPARLHYVEGSFATSDFIPGLVSLLDQTPGRISVGGSVLGTDAFNSGSGSLGQLVFAVGENFSGRTQLTAVELTLRRPDGTTEKQRIDARILFAGAEEPILSLDFDLREGDQQRHIMENVAPGQVHHLQLNIANAPEISGWNAVLFYNPAQLHYVANSFRPGLFIPGLVGLVNEGEGFVAIGGAALGTDANNEGNGSLGQLAFEISPHFDGVAQLRAEQINLRRTDSTTLKLSSLAEAIFTSDRASGTAVFDPATTQPTHTALLPNYPNPFNTQTTIRYQLAESAPVRIEIYDLQGQLIQRFSNYNQHPGVYSQAWNGSDGNGRRVSSGIYILRLKAGNFTQMHKMLLLK